jgi:hypothetical protein
MENNAATRPMQEAVEMQADFGQSYLEALKAVNARSKREMQHLNWQEFYRCTPRGELLAVLAGQAF